ncbi:MAG: ATP-grasp domain-containing protein [Acidobacteria bacterium]|nr:ATP-grasp domain-containing protein [Acidobacteriota bacterium]
MRLPTRAPRVLLVAATTGYQIRSFGVAAERLGAKLILATDRCHRLDDPWRDGAVPIRFHDEDAAVRAIAGAAAAAPFDAVLAVGDRPALIGALAARVLGLPAHPPAAVRVAGHKLKTRMRLRAAGLRTPWFRSIPVDRDNGVLLERVAYPCVVKPLGLAASRGVIRADTPVELVAAAERLRRLLASPEIRSLRDPANDSMAIEEYIPGREIAVEGVVTNGELEIFAIFDKPDPLEGPFFEETIYVTPDRLLPGERRDVVEQVRGAVEALGLTHGPIHAECRLGPRGAVVIEVAARPIGGLCSRVLRFSGASRGGYSLEEVLLQHALGRPVARHYAVTREASAVMMIPVPGAGICQGVAGLDAARSVPLVEDIIITTKPGQRLVPWPEGASYPGFIFARGRNPEDVVAAVRAAHDRLAFRVAPEIAVTAAMG